MRRFVFIYIRGIHPAFGQSPSGHHDFYAYLQQADVFVLPPRQEVLPILLIEASLSARGSCRRTARADREEILMNGRYGTLVPAGDSEAHTEAMRDAFLQTLLTFDPVEAGRCFTYERSVRTYLDLAFSPPSGSPKPLPDARTAIERAAPSRVPVEANAEG